jgi:hypothetical protein
MYDQRRSEKGVKGLNIVDGVRAVSKTNRSKKLFEVWHPQSGNLEHVNIDY